MRCQCLTKMAAASASVKLTMANSCDYRVIPDQSFQRDDELSHIETICHLHCVTCRIPRCGAPSGFADWCPQHAALHRTDHNEYHRLSNFNQMNNRTLFQMAEICRDVRSLPDEISATDFETMQLYNRLPRRIQLCQDVIDTLPPLQAGLAGLGEQELRLRHSFVFFLGAIDGDRHGGHLYNIISGGADFPTQIRRLNWANIRNELNSKVVLRRSLRLAPVRAGWGRG